MGLTFFVLSGHASLFQYSQIYYSDFAGYLLQLRKLKEEHYISYIESQHNLASNSICKLCISIRLIQNHTATGGNAGCRMVLTAENTQESLFLRNGSLERLIQL